LVVRPDEGDEVTAPLADVATVLIGLKTSLGATVLQQLASHDVVLLACDWNGVPSAATYTWGEHTRIGARHRAQVDVSLPRQKNAWGQIIRAKVTGQAENLRCLEHKDWKRLAEMAKNVRSGDPGNVEGVAARFYWSRLFSGDKFSRVPRLGEGRNAMLDYGYAVLRGYGIRAVLSAGLSASIGLFHHNRANAFNLVDDLIEPFRPAVDWTVATTPPEMTIRHPAVKHRLVGASTQAFTPDGLSVAAVLTDVAQQLGRYFEGDIEKMTVPAWHGPVKAPVSEFAGAMTGGVGRGDDDAEIG
jgi:CRISPR-associated protein Cas1